MNRYLYASLFGLGAFLFQLLSVLAPHISRINREILSSSTDELTGVTALKLSLPLFFYFLLGTCTHVAPMLLASRVHADLGVRGPHRIRKILSRRGSLSIVLLTTLALLGIANHTLFPRSLAFFHANLLLEQRASIFLTYGLSIISALSLGYWGVFLSGRRVQFLLTISSIFWITVWAWPHPQAIQVGTLRSQPDLIVIGIDSLRPDHLRSFGYSDPSPAPTIDKFVSDSVRFSQAYTPLARTFVAYSSILTGQYPTNHGARENLYPPELIKTSNSIAHALGRHGYTSLFAMDESRFANFDRDFGFDKVVSPPAGAVDFLVGTFLDTAGTNLLQLVPHADRLMPHIAGNRAASNIYQPHIHSKRLSRAINSLDHQRPWFLVSHFCMAHWPYARGESLMPPASPFEDSPGNYRQALSIADSQVTKLLSQLRTLGRLDNAIVVLLSDHGEGLGMSKDNWLILQADGRSIRTVNNGHGKPALDTSQSSVLLSFQRYRNGKPVWLGVEAHHTASLVDIAPTLFKLAKLEHPPERFDGEPLLEVSGHVISSAERSIFLESGLSGNSLQSKHVDEVEVANEFGHLYRTTADLRFELYPSGIPEQLRNKQRAIIRGGMGLSSNPDKFGEIGCWFKLNLDTRKGECLSPTTNDPTVRDLKPHLCRHFASDLQFHSEWCSFDVPRTSDSTAATP